MTLLDVYQFSLVIVHQTVNQLCNEKKLNCASNKANYASHIFDYKDENDDMGATVSVVISWFADQYQDGEGRDWRALAWWIHDNLPHCGFYFFSSLAAFNISWCETNKEKTIHSYIKPKGCLTKEGMDNYEGDHSEWYEGFPK